MSLDGLSTSFKNIDADVIETLKAKEQEEKEEQAQNEVLKLMTSNREQLQYKHALTKTISTIKKGAFITEENNDGK
jgi:uncharacterized membrane protein YgaE (UPF0421/DUF939 family)